VTIKSITDQVSIKAASWGEELEPPATKVELDTFYEKVSTIFSVDLPSEYKEFLLILNGLEFNGLIIYGTKNSELDPNSSPLDFVEMNEVMRDSEGTSLPSVVVLGEDSTGIITYDSMMKEIQYRDRIALDRIEPYLSFEDMLKREVDKVL